MSSRELEAERLTQLEKDTTRKTTSFKLQSYWNTLIHILNGSVAFCLTVFLIKEVKNGWPSTRDIFPLHAFLCAIGYQLFMAEAILVFYAPNSWSYFLSYKIKRHLHWILQLFGAIFIICGNFIAIVIRTTPLFATIHGISGLISMILLVITILQGVCVYFAYDLRSYVKPMTSRFVHNCVSVLCFLIGMFSLVVGYGYGSDYGVFDTKIIEYSLIVIAVVTTVFSIVGAVKSELQYILRKD
ncbi:hypothetical protein Bhyg_15467 [Pseudolycoriella hygida]|uniref:ascorbate ferrireductase (transmembrane) n=1 Tax=Pseudolycoriella hygida TaxID=35572 RepID=A0A9Q0MKF3_9DIPT|nr:hypothetical protein Bhyg_15467 [Pseudolycoriella hygida]